MVDIDYDEVVHLTQFALGAGAKNGERVVIQVENNEDEPVVLGTLICGTCDQFCADLMVGGGDLVRISHTSKKATVHITGYKQEDIFSDDESLDLPPLEGEELPEDELEDLRAQVKKHVKKNKEKGQDLLDEDFTDSDSDSDDSDSDSDDEDFGGNPSNFSDDDDDDNDEGLSSESMETGSEDSDDSEDDDSGSESESESESSEDEEDKLKKLKGRKRADSSPASPQTPKRSKTSDSAPSSAASTPGGTPVLGDAKSYEADLVNFLKQNGETSMAIIGTRVKKPSGVPKLKQFIVTRPGVFKRSGDKIGLA